MTIGTSDKGTLVDELPDKSITYNHALLVFGGLHGIETALESDEQLQVGEASLLFDHYLNVLPQQGSRTIRTEEAILVTLSSLRTKLKANNESIRFSEGGIATSSSFPSNTNIEIKSKVGNVDLSKFD